MIERLFELAGITVDNDLLLEAAYDNMVTAIKQKFPDQSSMIDDNIKQAKKILTAPDKKAPTSDKMIWYIKVLRAFLLNDLNTVKGNYNFKDMEQFNNDFFHYYGFNIPQIFNTELANQNISELFTSLQNIVQQYQKSDKPPVPVQQGDHEIIKCNDGTSWWFVDRAYCDEEGRSGKHCGNVVGKRETDQRILSLRTPNHNVILTFILLPNGYLGEMKAKANLKPSPKYHPNIMQLLLNPMVKGIKGAGYHPWMNFSIFDLSEQDINVLIHHNKESFITNQIESEPIEFLKAPDYIKNNKEYRQIAVKELPALKHLIGHEKSLNQWEYATIQDPSLIIHAPPELPNFKELVIHRLTKYPEELLKAPKSIAHDYDIIKDIISQSGATLAYVPTELKTFELCKMAINDTPFAIAAVPTNLENYEELARLAVQLLVNDEDSGSTEMTFLLGGIHDTTVKEKLKKEFNIQDSPVSIANESVDFKYFQSL